MSGDDRLQFRAVHLSEAARKWQCGGLLEAMAFMVIENLLQLIQFMHEIQSTTDSGLINTR